MFVTRPSGDITSLVTSFSLNATRLPRGLLPRTEFGVCAAGLLVGRAVGVEKLSIICRERKPEEDEKRL
jgi:hypothetical protein